jgi:hypothetical protein
MGASKRTVCLSDTWRQCSGAWSTALASRCANTRLHVSEEIAGGGTAHEDEVDDDADAPPSAAGGSNTDDEEVEEEEEGDDTGEDATALVTPEAAVEWFATCCLRGNAGGGPWSTAVAEEEEDEGDDAGAGDGEGDGDGAIAADEEDDEAAVAAVAAAFAAHIAGGATVPRARTGARSTKSSRSLTSSTAIDVEEERV